MKRTILLGLCFIFFILTGCTQASSKQSRLLLNTVVEITIYDRKSEQIMNDLFQEIQYMENKYSRYIANSEISNINSNAGKAVIVSEDSFELIQKGIYFGTISDDLFDISIGPLVDLWGISGDNQHIPSQDDIDSTMLKVDYRNISMDNQNKSISIAEGMSLDTGAIAKGFVTDKLVGILREKNVKSALLNLGGNLYLYGSKPDTSLWTVGIRDPFGSQGDHLGTVAVKDMSVVTSGIYERYFEKDGERLHHILNPKTGYPSDNGLAAVSILSPNSTNCDGLSTACFLLGVDKGMELIEQFENVEAIMVTTDKKVYVSGGEVAAALGISPNYLSHLFKKCSDCGFIDYVSQVKIKQAKKIMAEKNLKVYEVANELGFDNAFYFSKVFKKVEGCSPSEYMNKKLI